MQLLWQTLTLNPIPFETWSRRSFLARITTLPRPWAEFVLRYGGISPAWQHHSWLLRDLPQLSLWLEPLAIVIVSAMFMVAPFVPTTLIGLLLLAAAAIWLSLALIDPPGQGLTPIHLMVLAYWGVSTVATAFSPVRTAAIDGWIKLTLYLLFFALMARILRSPRIRSTLISLYLLTTLIVSAYGMRQWFLGARALATWVDPTSPLAQTTRVYSYLGNPNLLASYLIPAVLLSIAAVFVWQGWGCKLLALFAAGLNMACLVLTFSRGGWIGFVLGGLALALLLVFWWSRHWSPFWQTWAIPMALGLLIGGLVLAVVTVEPIRLRVQSMVAGRADSSNNFRRNVWEAVFRMIQARPVLGIGPGNDAFNQIYPLFQNPKYTALSAYSVILEIAVETGFVGLTCFLWLMGITFHQGWTQLQRLGQQLKAQVPQPTRPTQNYQSYCQSYWLMGAIATLIGILGHGLVDTVWYRPQVNTLWWLAMALVASYYRRVDGPTSPLPDPSPDAGFHSHGPTG